MNQTRVSPNRTRALASGMFVFVAVFAAIVWYLVRPYGSVYFFPVHFLIGLGLPFLFYAIGATGGWFRVGLVATAVLLAAFNVWGHEAGAAAPRVMDWSNVFAGLVGLVLAWGVQRIQARARPPHRPSEGR